MSGFQNIAQAYVQGFGTKQTDSTVVLQRSPDTNDTNYPIGTLWIDQSAAQTYYLLSLSNASGQLQANWELISKSSVLVTLSDTSNANIVSPSDSTDTPPNNIQIAGGTGIQVVGNPSTNTLTINNTGSSITLTTQDLTVVGPSGGTINLVGNGSITTVGNSGTSTATVELTGLTANNVLTGAGTTTINKVSPSATSGVPLISQGSSSQPAFGTAVVAGGGTGNTSFTANAPIIANTTTTGALTQATSGFSNIGYVLTSTGSSSPPTWQAVSGGVTSVSGTANRITSTGGTTPVIDIAATYVGQTSITTLGTITTGTWNGTSIDLAHGGTNANLTASNGGIFYSTASAGAILAGTATANRVLVSGASTAPSWSTSTYPVTNSTGDIIYGSATNTFSVLSAPTTPGEFLSYNTSPNWANYYNTITYFEDFLEYNLSFGSGGGGSGGTNYPSSYQTYQHPGVIDIYTSGGYANYSLHSRATYYVGGGQIWIDMVIKIASLADSGDNFAVLCGLSDTQDTSSSNNNIIFSYKYNANGGNWQLICQNSGVSTTSNTSTAADTNWHRFSISINAAATSVTFYIDGVSVGTVTTNIPANTTALNFTVANVNQSASTGALKYVAIDLMNFYQSLTTSR